MLLFTFVNWQIMSNTYQPETTVWLYKCFLNEFSPIEALVAEFSAKSGGFGGTKTFVFNLRAMFSCFVDKCLFTIVVQKSPPGGVFTE